MKKKTNITIGYYGYWDRFGNLTNKNSMLCISHKLPGLSYPYVTLQLRNRKV